MADAIGPDGLTDGERAWVATYGWRRPLSQLAAERLAHAETRAKHAEWSANKERRHAEEKALERARAERAEADAERERMRLVACGMAALDPKQLVGMSPDYDSASRQDVTGVIEGLEAERDRLRAALELVSLRQEPDGPCWCVFQIPKGSAHHITCSRARALLGEVKP